MRRETRDVEFAPVGVATRSVASERRARERKEMASNRSVKSDPATLATSSPLSLNATPRPTVSTTDSPWHPINQTLSQRSATRWLLLFARAPPRSDRNQRSRTGSPPRAPVDVRVRKSYPRPRPRPRPRLHHRSPTRRRLRARSSDSDSVARRLSRRVLTLHPDRTIALVSTTLTHDLRLSTPTPRRRRSRVPALPRVLRLRLRLRLRRRRPLSVSR